ncbi:MAG: hypothetical protein GY820_41120 [Gammaproteobacteria bacterium]|nr:hypothetical protein [Gammaproteobacteria bacterium]
MAMRKEPDTPKKEKPKRKWRPGVSYKCIHSASPGYKVGDVCKVYANDDGHMCMMGRDGLEDLCTMLVSEFKEDE